MRKYLITMVILFLILTLSAWTVPEGVEVVSYSVEEDYMDRMLGAAQEGSENSMRMGAIYEVQRNMKIEDLGVDFPLTSFFTRYNTPAEVLSAINTYLYPGFNESQDTEPWYTDDDVRIVATVVYNEAWYDCTDRHRELVAAVIFNRVNSPIFPDTVYDVICQKGQYSPAYTVENGKYHNKATKNEDAWNTCVEIAKKALNGGVECPEKVVFQSNYSNLGKGHYEIHKTSYSTTYFAYGEW